LRPVLLQLLVLLADNPLVLQLLRIGSRRQHAFCGLVCALLHRQPQPMHSSGGSR
jgi:hypothetical protein